MENIFKATILTQHVFNSGLLQCGKNSIRDARTPRPGEIGFNTMRYRSSETVHRLEYFHSTACKN